MNFPFPALFAVNSVVAKIIILIFVIALTEDLIMLFCLPKGGKEPPEVAGIQARRDSDNTPCHLEDL